MGATLTSQQLCQGLSAATVGRLISGFGERDTSLYRQAVVDLDEMVRTCRVTFRPLPKGYRNQAVMELREDLEQALRRSGVDVVPWERAAVPFRQKLFLPILHRPFHVMMRAVHGGVHAVFDVERPVSPVRRLGIGAVESLYRLTCLLRPNVRRGSVMSIGRLSIWADDHVAKYLQDHSRTQIVTLAQFDSRLVDPQLPYDRRVGLGLTVLARLFSQIVIGVHGGRISVLNMNLTDSVVRRDELDAFVRGCLVPKLFLPIAPLLPSQFEVGRYDPRATDSAGKLIDLSESLGRLGLLPGVEAVSGLLRRRSRRDMARAIMLGRTGVSFGFIAFIEPPHYVGPVEISERQWRDLPPSPVYSPDEIRRNAQGRLYAKIQSNGITVFRQVPDLWIASSRSGCDKSHLRLDRDVIRIGYNGHLRIERPDQASAADDVNPSYDIRVMVATALATALYAPHLLAAGAPLFHFHGYPHRDWFAAAEAFAGADNPAVPCGTMEAGVFNFQAMAQLAARHGPALKLACFVEPDHGANLLAGSIEYLVARLRQGVERGQLTLGGGHLASLRTVQAVNAVR